MTANFFGHDFVELLYVAEIARRSRVGDAILSIIKRGRSGDRIFASINESHTAMHTLLCRRDYRQSDTILNLIQTIRSWCL